ncbi:MerR family DNA-binding protein [Streptomyces spectabilis]|uniref:MerR family transcriptional regulator n=1 Tax=Streptomyces spectabilis TaxID=68270 RepID=A0A516RHK9_STRST|nr:MerR family DNA-binding protein [Streptomyces spectabilis]QDQ15141.1 MerR family transcriptional regulator [Streptomyces spectabilis]
MRQSGTSPARRQMSRHGTLAPARDAVGRCHYGTADLTRVAVIPRAKEAGLALDTIRSLVTTTDAGARRSTLRQEADALRSRIAAAQAPLALVEWRQRRAPALRGW